MGILFMSDAQPGSAKGVIAYLILAFGIAWGFWEWLLPNSAASNLSRFEIYALPGAFAPAIATFIVRKWITREGFADAGLGLHLDKWRYYLIAWFLPLGVVAFIVAGTILLGLGYPDFSMLKALTSLAPHAKISPAVAHWAQYVVPLQLCVTAVVATPILFGEEFGWRGYLQLRVFPHHPTLAAIVTGIIWGLWHLFCVGAVLVSIIFGWLRERSGSVWVTSLAHSATNAVGGSLMVLWFPTLSKGSVVSYLGVLGWIPLGLLCLWIVASRANAAAAEQPA
jgi:membrane protease YdiL (CAAX protease family)